MEEQIFTPLEITGVAKVTSTPLSSIYNFCNELTKEYDESHNVNHHVKVFKNSFQIAISTTNDYRIIRLVTFASLLHDIIDDKYCNHEQKLRKTQALSDYLNTEVSADAHDILWIIEHISFSKEKKRGYPAQHDNFIVTQALRIVSDGDKLEAIGIVGLQRMLDFNMVEQSGTPSTNIARANNVESMVIRIRAHVDEKLSLLMDKYIHTAKGKELAEPLHNIMMEIVNNDDKLIAFIKTDSRYL